MRTLAFQRLEDRDLLTTVPMDASANVVTGLYRQILGREPDAGGLAGYQLMLQHGASLEDVAGSMWDSPEFRAIEVTAYYGRFLNRAPEAAGLSGWVDYLRSGHSEEEVIRSMLASDEFYRNAGGTNEGFLNALYLDLLGRPGQAEEINGWIVAMSKGTTKQSIAEAFTQSHEYRVASVTNVYQNVLDRAPDAGGLNFYSTHIPGNTWLHQVSVEILSSPENLERLETLADIPAPNAALEQLYAAMFASDYTTFYNILSANYTDPAFLAAIRNGFDDGQVLDEATPSVLTNVSVKDLHPSQSQIFMQNSLEDVLSQNSGNKANEYLDGGVIQVGSNPILVGADGTFIIDGHHRWSRLILFNPDNTRIVANEMTSFTDSFGALEATQLAIVAEAGNLPSDSGPANTNLYTVDETTFKNYVNATISTGVTNAFLAHGITNPADYLWNNVLRFRIDNQPITGAAAPDRLLMPQTDPTTVPKLNSGQVNYRKQYFNTLGG